ncbi:MAG: hypothetical protein KJ950_08875 [Proteobacteria bacterium]|nr:hypothetical protein [Pseudomonadota bacterium]MBU1686606.1 hypothetical protein [Pseudomonadota bacterium]
MFLNPWSLNLTLCAVIVLFLVGTAAKTAVRVLLYWDPSSDSNRQIRLEAETWLSATLVEYALLIQVLTLLLFVIAADRFSQMISGAMCATGTLTANAYGIPDLLIKLVGSFLYGFWILFHRIDISSERYPLVRFKFIFLLGLVPVILVDMVLQTLFLANLKPDIITSCCSVVFGDEGGGGRGNLLTGSDPQATLIAFYGLAGAIIMTGICFLWQTLGKVRRLVTGGLSGIFSLEWAGFLVVSLAAITTVFSSYIYAMPYHHCPFCIIKSEYGCIGIFIYAALLAGAFFGLSVGVVEPFAGMDDVAQTIRRYRRGAVLLSLVLLIIFTGLSSYHLLLYRLTGGA